MATQEKSSVMPDLGFDFGSFEATAERIRDYNEKLIQSTKRAGMASVDAYEKTLKSLVDFEEKVGQSSQLEWVSALASTHAQFIKDVSQAYTQAAREVLK